MSWSAMSEGDATTDNVGWASLGRRRRGLGWSVAATVMSEAGVIWEIRVREKEIESDGKCEI